MSIERRLFPRYPLVFSVNVQLKEDDDFLEFKAESVNISRSSIEIACDNELIDHLLDQDKYPHTCKLLFQLPQQNFLFEVDSQVVTHRRLSQRQYNLVLVFPEFAKEKGDVLGQSLGELQENDFAQILPST